MEINLKKINLMKLHEKPLYMKVVVCLSIFLILILLGIKVFVYPQRSKLEILAEKRIELETKVKLKEETLAGLKKYKDSIQDLEKSFEVLKKKLPEDADISSILTSITEIARDNKLKIRVFRPGKPIAKEFYVEVPIKVIIAGKFHEIGHFFESIAKSPRIINIASFIIDKEPVEKEEESSSQLILDMTMNIYYYKPTIKENES